MDGSLHSKPPMGAAYALSETILLFCKSWNKTKKALIYWTMFGSSLEATHCIASSGAKLAMGCPPGEAEMSPKCLSFPVSLSRRSLMYLAKRKQTAEVNANSVWLLAGVIQPSKWVQFANLLLRGGRIMFCCFVDVTSPILNKWMLV